MLGYAHDVKDSFCQCVKRFCKTCAETNSRQQFFVVFVIVPKSRFQVLAVGDGFNLNGVFGGILYCRISAFFNTLKSSAISSFLRSANIILSALSLFPLSFRHDILNKRKKTRKDAVPFYEDRFLYVSRYVSPFFVSKRSILSVTTYSQSMFFNETPAGIFNRHTPPAQDWI